MRRMDGRVAWRAAVNAAEVIFLKQPSCATTRFASTREEGYRPCRAENVRKRLRKLQTLRRPIRDRLY